MASKNNSNSLDIGFSKFLDYATLALKAVDNRYKEFEVPEVKQKKQTTVNKPKPIDLNNPFRGDF
tara:strand:- start:100 stop:294 length:195 start_codon:yes stop_codon:yes gene_type:complete